MKAPQEEQFSRKVTISFRGNLELYGYIFGYHNDGGATGLLLP